MVRWRLGLMIGLCGLALSSPALAVNDFTVGNGDGGTLGEVLRLGDRDDAAGYDNNSEQHFGW